MTQEEQIEKYGYMIASRSDYATYYETNMYYPNFDFFFADMIMYNYTEDLVTDFSKKAKNLWIAMPKIIEKNKPYIKTKYNVSYKRDWIASVELYSEEYIWTNIYPNTIIKTFIFDLKKEKQLFIKDAKKLEKIRDMILPYFEKKYSLISNEQQLKLSKWLEAKLDNYKNYVVETDGKWNITCISFIFDLDQIWDYSIWTPKVTLDKFWTVK